MLFVIRKLIIVSTASTIVFTHAWDQLVLNHANSKNIVFQGLHVFLYTLHACIQGVPKKTKTIEITNNNLIVRIWMP
jgi:hypothetical protein